jgi:RNA polymerase subunit RPABC4/transcription elongation factor Spt4|tara:strand:+ start:1138 stop:1281 length:144 start_codon:yes stop_codon:yes gene_type:complete
MNTTKEAKVNKENIFKEYWIALVCIITFSKVCPYCNNSQSTEKGNKE